MQISEKIAGTPTIGVPPRSHLELDHVTSPRITDRLGIENLGIYAYATGGIVLGVIGLVWGDFATNWQHVKPTVPYREGLAYATAILELMAGCAMLWRSAARVGAIVLTSLYAIFTLLWIPEIVHAPGVFDSWGNFFEEFSLVAAGLLACVMFAPGDSQRTRKLDLISRIYGVCPISFGIGHIIYFKAASAWVPTWIPPGQMFWTGATAVFFFMAAVAILTGRWSGLASRLLFAEIAGFELLIWIPKLVESPHQHFVWAGNAISIAMSGAAWYVSDVIRDLRKTTMHSSQEMPLDLEH